MDFRKLALTLLVMASMAAVGCGGDDATTDGGGSDGGTSDTCMTGNEYFFVINTLDIGQADPAGDPSIVPGFNLDGRVSDDTDEMGCLHTDYTSPPPDSETGVDNQLGQILGAVGSSFDVSGTIAENIADGSLLILAEVLHVDDAMNDGCVTLNLYLGELPAGVTMPMVDGMNHLTGGQTFDIDPASLVSGEPLITVGGSITNGRLRAGPVNIELNLPVQDMVLTLNIQQAQVRFNMVGETLTNGVIGGQLDVEETISTIVAIDPDTIPESLARSILTAQADLDYDPATMTCNAVSIGLVFGAVDAVKGDVAMPAM